MFNQGSDMKRFAFELECSGNSVEGGLEEGRARGRKTS